MACLRAISDANQLQKLPGILYVVYGDNKMVLVDYIGQLMAVILGH